MTHLDLKEKEEYINDHLFNELCWLLCAATEWSLQDQLKLEIGGYQVQVYAMDSAFLHARALFEFFAKKKPSNNHYSCKDFLPPGTILNSSSYEDDWAGPLHRGAMHIRDRSGPAPLKSAGVEKELKEMPVDFANEILSRWIEFERNLEACKIPGYRELGELARKKREEAIKSAACVVKSRVAEQHALEKRQLLQPVFIFAS
jgi:hypothetical protein